MRGRAISRRAEEIARFVFARWRWFAAGFAALAAAAACSAVFVAWLGVYNVAASEGHWYIIDRFLRFGMENSVEARAPNITPPELDDPDLVRLGAGHYYAGCAYCHGAPGQPITPISQDMLPSPPNLKEQVGEWTDQELFWLVKHGLKYTGMPAWPAQERDDEVWALVAFMRALPSLDEESYRDLALGRVEIEPRAGQEIATGSGEADAVDACARCHGAGAQAPQSALVPRLQGQTSARLLDALRQYRDRRRASGIMQTAASGLSEEQMQRLATYYGSLPPLPPSATAEAEDAARGGDLAVYGAPEREIPACLGCHAKAALPFYPRLAGQNARYIESRLRAWNRGREARTDTERVMAPIAQRLSEDEITGLAAYFSSRDPAQPDAEAER
jgi:cytochrome c553